MSELMIKPKNISTDMATDAEVTTQVNTINGKMDASIAQMAMFGNSTATTVSAGNTFYKIAGTTSANSNNKKFTHTDNKLTYTGTTTRLFVVNCSVSFTGTTDDIVAIRVAKNGTTIGGSQVRESVSGNGHVQCISTQSLVSLATNDYIEIFIAVNAAHNVTATEMNCLVQGKNFFDV